eukprot:38801_1
MAFEGGRDTVNHYKVAIEAVKFLEQEMERLGANEGSKASQKLNEIIQYWNEKMRTPFPISLEYDIRRILHIRNAISHQRNYHTIPELYEFTMKMASIKAGFALMRKSIESKENRFVNVINSQYSFTPDDVINKLTRKNDFLKADNERLRNAYDTIYEYAKGQHNIISDLFDLIRSMLQQNAMYFNKVKMIGQIGVCISSLKKLIL